MGCEALLVDFSFWNRTSVTAMKTHDTDYYENMGGCKSKLVLRETSKGASFINGSVWNARKTLHFNVHDGSG